MVYLSAGVRVYQGGKKRKKLILSAVEVLMQAAANVKCYGYVLKKELYVK